MLYSDSSFFVDGWKHGKKWCTAVGRAHADVWRQFWSVAEDFGVETITVNKVKGHATQAMVDGGVVSEVERWGNAQADDAAKKGAAMHPDVSQTVEAQAEQRATAYQCALWMGVGLEAAQKTGALPSELTSKQKTDRPRDRPKKRLEVVPDQLWKDEHLHVHLTGGAHPSHALRKTGPFVFCTRCGCYGAQRLASLASPCEMTATPSRRYFLTKLIDGRHPRTGVALGAAEAVSASQLGPFSASNKRRSGM